MNADDMTYALDKDHRTNDGGCEQWEPCIKGLTASQVWKIMDTFAANGKASPADFSRARRRLFPPVPCTACDDTGQLWDGESYGFCSCDMGAHMRTLNERIAIESNALRPVWAAALPQEARRYENPETPFEALCGGCGAPLDSHRPEDLEVCHKLDKRNRLEVVK